MEMLRQWRWNLVDVWRLGWYRDLRKNDVRYRVRPTRGSDKLTRVTLAGPGVVRKVGRHPPRRTVLTAGGPRRLHLGLWDVVDTENRVLVGCLGCLRVFVLPVADRARVDVTVYLALQRRNVQYLVILYRALMRSGLGVKLGRLIGPAQVRRGITRPVPAVAGDPGPLSVLRVAPRIRASSARRAAAATDGAAAARNGKSDTEEVPLNRGVGPPPSEGIPEIGTAQRGGRAHRVTRATRASHPAGGGRGHRESLVPRTPASSRLVPIVVLLEPVHAVDAAIPSRPPTKSPITVRSTSAARVGRAIIPSLVARRRDTRPVRPTPREGRGQAPLRVEVEG